MSHPVPQSPLNAPPLTMRWRLEMGPLTALPAFYPEAASPDSVVITTLTAVVRVDGAGREIFRTDIAELIGAYAAIADINADGAPEIVVATSGGVVIVLTGAGRELWRHRLGAPLPDFKCVVAAPVAGDTPDLLLADSDGWVNCLDGAGCLRWRFKVDPFRASPPAVGDLDCNGSPEIVYGTDKHRVACLGADGRLRWQFCEPHNFGRSLPIIADIGRGPEVFITSSSPEFGSHLHCLRGDGSLRWAGDINQQSYAAIAIADVDGDGRPEVIVGDKSNTVFCFDRDGRRRWATDVGGHGIFWSPAIADVDGDGEMEILAGVRQNRHDGCNFFLLTARGEVKGAYRIDECQNTSPLVGDLDGDGVLEVVTTSRLAAAMACFTFGGAARPGAVASGCFRGSSSRSGSLLPPGKVQPPPQLSAAGRRFMRPSRSLRVGTNPLSLRPPARTPGAPVVELTRVWHGQRDTRLFDRPDLSAVEVELMPGAQEVEATLIDGASGERLRADARQLKAAPPASAPGQGDAEDARLMARLVALMSDAVSQPELLDVAARREIIAAADAIAEGRRLRADLARFTAATRAAGWEGPFAAWQDENPWDDIEPLRVLPPQMPAQPVVEAWALGNEYEHAALNLVALEGRPVTIHAAVEGLAGHLELLRPVWMPTEFDRRVPDMLLKSASATVSDVIPGQPCQLWLRFHTRGLEPGVHEATLTLTTLERSPWRLPVKVRLEVSPVALPDLPRTRVCVWRHVAPDGSGGLDDRVWADMLDHGVTIAYAFPPPQDSDEAGNLVGEPDWSRFDTAVQRLVGDGALLMIHDWGLQGLAPQWSPQWQRAMQGAALRVDAHLKALGVGSDRWVYYPVDEPCLTGEESVQRFLRYARLIREAAPHIRIYANPAGQVTTDFLRRMSPYTDVWCPSLAVVKRGPREWVEIMSEGGRPVWCYEAAGQVRLLKPLGYYRMQPWVAARHGLVGSGYWVHSYSNLWGVGDEEPAYGAAQVEPDGTLTTSRRWEASRDGIEDATLLHMLGDAVAAAEARGADAAGAHALRQEALDAIAAAQDAVDDLTRPIADYEMDFAAVQRYRRLLAEAIRDLEAR